MNKAILILFLILFSLNKDARSQTITMHRTQATTKDASGWYYAKSTHGNFAVMLPVPFNDFTTAAEDPNIGHFETHGIGSEDKDGIKLSVVEMPFTDRTRDPDLQDMPSQFSRGVAGIDSSKYAGFPAIYFSVADHDSGAMVKYVKTNKSLISLIIEYPLAFKAKAESYKKRFFNSLVLH